MSIASVIAHSQAGQLEAARCAIESLDGCRVVGIEDERIAVVIEAPTLRAVRTVLDALGAQPSIEWVDPVFYAEDDDAQDPPEAPNPTDAGGKSWN